MYQGGFLISRLNKVGGRIFERILAKQNIDAFNGAQGRILYVLWQQDSIPIREISEKTGLAVTSLTSMLDRMEAADLLRRTAAPSDRRKILIELTDKAKALRPEYDAVSEKMGEILYQGFSDDEIAEAERYLSRMMNNLEEWEK